MLRLASLLLALSLGLTALPALADEPPVASPPAASPPVAPPRALPPLEQPAALSYAYWPPPWDGMVRKSGGAMAAGIVFVVAGSIGMASGTGVYVSASDSCSSIPIANVGGGVNFTTRCGDTSGQIAGMTALIVSGLVVGGGIGLWIYGAQQVPKRENMEPPVAIRVGPGSAVVRWSF